jgi:YVTN family beta-propeller protein
MSVESARFGVGRAPRRVTFAPDGKTGYTANGSSNDISIINADMKKTTGRMTSGGETPRGIAISPDGIWLWVSNFTSANVVKIDLRTNAIVATIPVTYQPHRLVMLKNGTKLYVSHPSNDRVTVIDTATSTVLYTIRVGNQPGGMALQPTPAVE